jgi:methyl-accepting chemotaxis protein
LVKKDRIWSYPLQYLSTPRGAVYLFPFKFRHVCPIRKDGIEEDPAMSTPGVIPKDFPLRFAAKIVLIIAVGVVTTTALLYLSSQIELGKSYIEGIRTLYEAKNIIFMKSIIIYLISLVFIILGIIIISLFYSHKIAGPLYRIGSTVKNIGNGDFSIRIKLRHGDAVHSLAESINKLVESYENKTKELVENTHLLEKAATALQAAIESGEQEKLQKAVESLSEQTEKLQRSIADVRL